VTASNLPTNLKDKKSDITKTKIKAHDHKVNEGTKKLIVAALSNFNKVDQTKLLSN
jgi:hypothetical protein